MSVFSVAGDVELYFSDDGAGPPVVLLHGWACDGSDWNWLASDLTVDHRVLIPDHRGHGRSTAIMSRFGARVLAEDAAALLQHLSVSSAVVVGHSMGTVVASALAVERPDLVSALVLVDPVYGQTEDRIGSALEFIRQAPLETAAAVFSQFYVDESPPWLSFWHRRRMLGTPPGVVAEALCALYEGPDALGLRVVGERYLSRRACPMLAVYASNSADVAEWERTLPHGPDDRIIVWPRSGHFLHQERPEEFASLFREWLASLAVNGHRDAPALPRDGRAPTGSGHKPGK